METVASLKIVVFPNVEDKLQTAGKKCFLPASTSLLCKSTLTASLFDKQTRNDQRIDLRNLPEEPKNAKKRRQFSCPSIIDFSTLKSYQEIQPVHKPKRIFNGFFPSRVRSINAGLPGANRDVQEVIFEELVPNPNAPPCQEGVVLSRTTTNCSFRSEPITIPNYSDPRLSPRLPRKQDTRRVVYSVRNGSLSPWVDRYKLKQKSISTSSNMEVKNKACATGKPSVRGFSR